MNSILDKIPKLAITSLATATILAQVGTGQSDASNDIQQKLHLNSKMPYSEYVSQRYGLSSVEIDQFNSEVLNFLGNDENFKQFLIGTLSKLQETYTVFGSSLEIANDPNENYNQLRINIYSMDEDKFEKYSNFVDSWVETAPVEYLEKIVLMVA